MADRADADNAAETPATADLPGGPFRLNGPDGLAYLKLILDMADKSDRFLFEITRNNYLAFGALSLAGTGIFSSADRPTTVVMICIAVIAISLGSSSLSFLYFRYSSSLFAKAWMVEKAWLRGQRSDNLLAKYRGETLAARPRGAGSEPTRPPMAGQLSLSFERHRRWPVTFYPLANLFPALGAMAIILLVWRGWLTFKG